MGFIFLGLGDAGVKQRIRAMETHVKPGKFMHPIVGNAIRRTQSLCKILMTKT
jgi:hypothetical protein